MPLRAIGAPLPFAVGDGAADDRTARRRIRPTSGYRLRPVPQRRAGCDITPICAGRPADPRTGPVRTRRTGPVRTRRTGPVQGAAQCPISCLAAPTEAVLAASSVFTVVVTIT